MWHLTIILNIFPFLTATKPENENTLHFGTILILQTLMLYSATGKDPNEATSYTAGMTCIYQVVCVVIL